MNGTLLVSLLPRGEPFGASALAALDAETLELLAYRELPASEYLAPPEGRSPGVVEHCRGIAQAGATLYAAVFNGVRTYTVDDVRALAMRPGRILTDHRAVDLHGVDVAGDRLVAASTGSDAVVGWRLHSGASTTIALGADPPEEDLRFPHLHARERGQADWRACVSGSQHLNDVCLTDAGLVVCSLTRVARLTSWSWELLASDPSARFHDGRPAPDGSLLLTDAARGTLVDLNRRTLAIAEPARWFVRGLTVDDNQAFVLRSAVVATRQRDARSIVPDVRRRGAAVGVTVVDLARWQVVAERDVWLPEAASGTVAYKVLRWQPVAVRRLPSARLRERRMTGAAQAMAVSDA